MVFTKYHSWKMLMAYSLSFFAVLPLKGQTFAEWFNQKQTQRKYLQQQIAALKVYIAYAKKGYAIAKDGLDFIGNATSGEWMLHTDYFHSLESVNPEIKRYARIGDIISLQLQVIQKKKKLFRDLDNTGTLATSEISYLHLVFQKLLSDCAGILDGLIMMTTDRVVEMKDEERIHSIENLYLRMLDNFTFSQVISDEAVALAFSRLQDKSGIENSRKLYGIKLP